MTVWIVSPTHASRCSASEIGEGAEWCYLGTDPRQRARVAEALAFARDVPVREAVTRLASEIKQPFLDWIADVGACQPDPVRWWGSALASASPLQTDFFLLVCYAELVRSWLRPADGATTRRIIVVEHPWVACLLRQHLAGDSRVRFLGVGWSRCALNAAVWMLQAPFAVLATLLWALHTAVVVRRTFRGTKEPFADDRRRAVLIYTWIQPRCVANPGSLTDPWTGRLEDILRAHGERVIRVTPLTIASTLLESLKGFASHLLITARYLTVGDLWRGVGRRFRLHHLAQCSRFRGWRYTALLFQEQLREWSQMQFAQTHLFYRAMRRLAQRDGAKVKCLIYPFENQPWEKLLCLAWREQAPHVTLIGYQHSWVPPLLLPYALGARARDTTPLPDRIVTNSEISRRALTSGGYPEERLINGGALRYESFQQPRDGHRSSAAAAADRRRVVLVAFPLHEAQSHWLLSALLEELRHPVVIDGEAEPVQFVLKLHPSLPLRRFWRRPFAPPPWIVLCERPMNEVLAEADLMVYAGPTSSWWEAALAGVPVMKYQPDLLDLEAGAELEGLSVRCCAGSTLRDTITACLREGGEKRVVPDEVVQRLCTRVDERVWLTLTEPH